MEVGWSNIIMFCASKDSVVMTSKIELLDFFFSLYVAWRLNLERAHSQMKMTVCWTKMLLTFWKPRDIVCSKTFLSLPLSLIPHRYQRQIRFKSPTQLQQDGRGTADLSSAINFSGWWCIMQAALRAECDPEDVKASSGMFYTRPGKPVTVVRHRIFFQWH